MRVVSLINGSLSSETASIYALHYASKLSYKISLVYIKEREYSQELEKSFQNIKHSADFLEVECELLIFENLKEFKNFIQTRDIDMLFCSSRYKHSIFDRSFAQSLVKMDMKVDLAIAYQAKAEIYSIDKISKNQLSKLDSVQIKERLKEVIFNLRHYYQTLNLVLNITTR
jgi:hypothetical protein